MFTCFRYVRNSNCKAPKWLSSKFFREKADWKGENIDFRINQLIMAYKMHGHKVANLNPIPPLKNTKDEPLLNPLKYGLDLNDQHEYVMDGIISVGASRMTIKKLLIMLESIYCSHIGIEVQHLPEEEKEWLFQNFEHMQTNPTFSDFEKKTFLNELLKAQAFEKYLSVKFPTVKRYGLEGAETIITFFQSLFQTSVSGGTENIVIGSPHRGRLSLLCILLKLPPALVFRKMKGFPEFSEEYRFTGDVLSHLRNSVELDISGKFLRVSMLPNPSHLETISPVVVGKIRSMLQRFSLGDYACDYGVSDIKMMAVQMHGDAAFSGQGVIMETLAMSKVPQFRIGGSLHLIVNNQLGYTTPDYRGRSSFYCSDIMKMIGSPVIHVNGAFPEEVAKAAILAFFYWKKFRKDVLVNLFCFRRHGHNEMDDPTFTNPMMYQSVNTIEPFPDAYYKILEQKGITNEMEKQHLLKEYASILESNMKSNLAPKQFAPFTERWKSFKQASFSVSVWDTGLPVDFLKYIGLKSALTPPNFVLHSTLKKHFVRDRIKKIESGHNIDWATAESLAVGSLLCQGYNVRISGQDVGRGTFSQRHFTVIDQHSGEEYVPLNHLFPIQRAFVEIANSILSEEAVLGFEFGFSIDNPNTLVMWEAQFGDFFNSAQVVFDTCISSCETKWLIQSGIVILLPHGYDGAGPEHSSCRIERFLQMCDSKEDCIDGDNVNWNVVNPSTPAQFFHLLRKQMICTHRKPLIVVAPKAILRHPLAVSSITDMSVGTTFNPVITGISKEDVKSIKHIIFCSGKHYYTLWREKDERKKFDTAIIRIEELCPFPAVVLNDVIRTFTNAKSFTWSQEEHQNMGAWSFVNIRFQNIFSIKLKYVGRKPLSAPAVGIKNLHEEEIKEILSQSFQA